MLHLRVHGKGGKVRYLPLHPGTAELVTDYLEARWCALPSGEEQHERDGGGSDHPLSNAPANSASCGRSA